jgi:hypothetical protein
MGHEIYYQTTDHRLGDVSLRRWEEISKLLPLFVDFVNRAMRKEWGPRIIRDVVVFEGLVTAPKFPPPDEAPPEAKPFALERMLSEEMLGINEIYFHEASEWHRLFQWCDFLATHDGAYALYVPLGDTVRRYFAELEE